MADILVDEIWLALGRWGRYQWTIVVLLLLFNIAWAFQMMSTPFLAAVPSSYHCIVHGNYSLNETVPWELDDGEMYHSQCRMYVEPFDNETMKCDSGWSYPEGFPGSIVTQWDLVCDDRYRVSLSTSVMMVGVMVGNWKVSELSDHFGRKKVLIASFALHIVVGVLMAVSWNYWVFFSLRFLMGICMSGFGITGYVMRTELLPKSERIYGTFTFGGGAWNIGIALLALFAWLVPNWRELQLTLTVPTVVLLSYWWLVPESLHWLMTHGRHIDAKNIIKKAAKMNKVQLSEQDIHRLMYRMDSACTNNLEQDFDVSINSVKPVQSLANSVEHKLTLLAIFRHPYLRCYSIVLGYSWFVLSLVYYGLALTIGQLPGNSFLIFAMFGLCQIPVDVAATFVINKLGRRIPLCLTLCLGGVLLIIAVLMPEQPESGPDLSWFITTIAMLGKINISIAFNVVYLYTVEVFPTIVRNIGLGFMSLCTRIGGILAPFVIYADIFGRSTPYLIFGVLSITAGIFCVVLPETSGVHLGDTLEQVLKPRVNLICCKHRNIDDKLTKKVERNNL